MKHVKYHAEWSKYPFHPGVEIFSFQPEVKGTCTQKKLNFTSPTCNMPLRKRCSEYMQQIYRGAPMLKCDFNRVAKQLH